jgi:hypothetical protein
VSCPFFRSRKHFNAIAFSTGGRREISFVFSISVYNRASLSNSGGLHSRTDRAPRSFEGLDGNVTKRHDGNVRHARVDDERKDTRGAKSLDGRTHEDNVARNTTEVHANDARANADDAGRNGDANAGQMSWFGVFLTENLRSNV